MTNETGNKDPKSRAQRVLEIEAQAIMDLLPKIGSEFTEACELCLQCRGRVIVTGMGKSGHIGSKIAATLASTGKLKLIQDRIVGATSIRAEAHLFHHIGVEGRLAVS